MSDTKHISMRIEKDILARVDAEAKRMRWSRNAALSTCVEFGLVELEMERGPGESRDERVRINDQGGISAGNKNSAVGKLESGGEGGGKTGGELLADGGSSSGAGGGNRKGNPKDAKAYKEVSDKSSWYPHSMCPHGWVNSFACERVNGGCKR
jgi:hypothetical protein